MAQGAPSTSSFTYTYSFDVFLSFRGEDTRTGFTGNLYNALCQRGVLTFIDDKGLRRGEEITPALFRAIEESRLAIVIFSRNYATSKFCLNELCKILECMKAKGQWVWPIFYDVDPSEVRYQSGSYGKALAKHEGKFKDCKEKVQKWRLALHEAANLSGWHFKHGHDKEHVFIGRIIEEVSRKINRRLLHIANHPVGLETRMIKVQSLLNVGFDKKVNMLGIYGIGGMGKSTVARAMYNLIADQFVGSCFLADVREKSTKHGLVQLQETLLFELVGEKNIKLGDVNQGIPILKRRLQNKKVLIILDDVNKMEQLQATAGELDWFGCGSIIIITTRDKHLLDLHGVDRQYQVDELNDAEALELFKWNAFKMNEVDPSYMEIIERAIRYAHGLPLFLETIGSNLFGKTLDEWKSALDAYERIPNRDVLKILRGSFDGLEENEKEIFLDIACFFKGCAKRYIKNMLYARGLCPEYGMSVLSKKSLIKIFRYYGRDVVTMHDLIQCMGKEIIRQESPLEPDKRSRLWFYEDIVRVSEENKANDKIEAMMLDLPEDKKNHWNQKCIGKMKNLRMLIIKNASFFRRPKYLPRNLRVLEWWGYPSASLPCKFHSKKLVILNLSHSRFEWDKPLKKSERLRHMIFTGCEYLRQIPDVSGFPNVIELCVDDCTNLIEIHDSVGFLDKLQWFSAKRCTKLRVIPRRIKLTSLESLSLRECSNLEIFPEILAPMEKLQLVDLAGTAIENLPFSVQNLRGLQILGLDSCRMLSNNTLSNIIQMLPNSFTVLEKLDLGGTNLAVLPACIEECRFLISLNLEECKQLREIRGLPLNIAIVWADNCTSLNPHCSALIKLCSRAKQDTLTEKSYALPGQRIPEWFDHSSRGGSLCFWFRKEFPAFTVCVVLGVHGIKRPVYMKIRFHAKINGIEKSISRYSPFFCEVDHTLMYYFDPAFVKVRFGRLVSKHEWNHAEVSCVKHPDSDCSGSITWTGVHVNREISSIEDVRFTNPNPPKCKCDHSRYCIHDIRNQLMLRDKGLCEAQDIHQPQQLALFNPIVSKGCKTVEYTQEDQAWTIDNDWLSMRPCWEQPQPLDYVYRNSDLEETEWTNIDTISDQDREVLVHPAKSSGESSQTPGFVETKMLNIQAPSPTSSRGKGSAGELHLKPCCTVLPTTIDEFLRNQTELTHDDVEMEAFYASLDTDTPVLSCSYDKSATTAPSKEAKEALKTVQDFISNDASILLHPELCSVMKASLDYLSNLSADDGLSMEMRTLILKASREFTHWSRDYVEASKKIESTASELLRDNELEASLEGNKNQFREVVASENELLDKLASLEESKKELEEQINAIKANISASQSERNMTRKRKRDVFEVGMMLKTQR